MQFHPGKGFYLKKLFCADGFHPFTPTRGDVRTSLAPGYQYFARIGLNPMPSVVFSISSYSFMGCIKMLRDYLCSLGK